MTCISLTKQVAKCGNSVCPDKAEALAGTQFPEAVAPGEGRATAWAMQPPLS